MSVCLWLRTGCVFCLIISQQYKCSYKPRNLHQICPIFYFPLLEENKLIIWLFRLLMEMSFTTISAANLFLPNIYFAMLSCFLIVCLNLQVAFRSVTGNGFHIFLKRLHMHPVNNLIKPVSDNNFFNFCDSTVLFLCPGLFFLMVNFQPCFFSLLHNETFPLVFFSFGPNKLSLPAEEKPLLLPVEVVMIEWCLVQEGSDLNWSWFLRLLVI